MVSVCSNSSFLCFSVYCYSRICLCTLWEQWLHATTEAWCLSADIWSFIFVYLFNKIFVPKQYIHLLKSKMISQFYNEKLHSPAPTAPTRRLQFLIIYFLLFCFFLPLSQNHVSWIMDLLHWPPNFLFHFLSLCLFVLLWKNIPNFISSPAYCILISTVFFYFYRFLNFCSMLLISFSVNVSLLSHPFLIL